jgi:small subunit ribosomal protein S8
MSVNDPVSDMLTRLRNGARAGLPEVVIPHSRLKADIAHILKSEGFVGDVGTEADGVRKVLRVKLRFARGERSILRGLRRVSKPGLRRYVPADDLPRPLGGLGIAIISTSRGIMSDRQARQANVGGEVLCYVW